MLLAIMVMLTLALIAMTATAPYVVTQIKRDREDELIHRGRAYATAVKRFYKRFGRYPARLEELQNTQNIRFIRKLYDDPMSKDGKWRIIHLGEAKYFPKGFGFNGPSQGIGGAGAVLPGGVSTILGGGPQPGAANQPNQPNTGGMTPAEQISKPLGTGSTFGGMPVIGVASINKSSSIHEVNERSHYNEWEFFYDPRYDIAAIMPGPATQQVQPGGLVQPGGFGQQPGGFGQPTGGPGQQPGPR